MQPALAPRMNTSAQDHVTDQMLREQLLAQSAAAQPQDHSHHLDVMQQPDNPSPTDHSGAENAGTGNDTTMNTESGDDGGDGTGDGRKGYGKRELSTSKRAAQNRAAQRAFRQRKEGYIKKLEEQVRDYTLLHENFKTVQAENYQLRDYIISLQSRLLESQGEVPSPPGNVDGLEVGKTRMPLQPLQGQALGNLPQPGNIQPDLQTAGQPSAYRPVETTGPANKRARMTTTEMDPAQTALQGQGVLGAGGAKGGR